MMRAFVSTFALLSCVAVPAYANTLAITSSQDTTIFKLNPGDTNNPSITPGNSNGGGIGMFAGTDGNGANGNHRALIQFDIGPGNGLNQIPAGSIITGVTLDLVLGMVAGGAGSPGSGDTTPRQIDLYRVTTPWVEGTAQAGTTQIGGTGQGAVSPTPAATWNFSVNPPGTTWTTPGGDHAATASATQTVGNPPNFSTHFQWSSSQMISDVQMWLDTPSSNNGWELINQNEADQRTFRAFFTRDAANVPAQANFIPQLIISYTPVPEPSTYLLALVAVVGLGLFARRKAS